MKNQKVVNQVYLTNDYSMFKQLNGNRAINRGHLRRLSDSMAKKQLISPIIVNEKYEIIDGQHRFNACRENNLPVYYIVINGYSLNEVQVLNTNMSNWRKIDYLNAYCDLGYPEYMKFRELMTMFPELNFSSIEAIACGSRYTKTTNKSVKSESNSMGHVNIKTFENGDMVIKSMNDAVTHARRIIKVKPYYDGFNRRGFVTAMLSVFRNDNYDHNKFLNKLDYMRDGIYHCSNVTQYKMLIEDIYNHRSRTRINLRF